MITTIIPCFIQPLPLFNMYTHLIMHHTIPTLIHILCSKCWTVMPAYQNKKIIIISWINIAKNLVH